MHTVTSEIDIDLPIRTVYDQWTQFEDYPAFMSAVDEVNQLDDRSMYWAISISGVKRGFQAEITEQIPEERIAWRSTSGPEHYGVVTFHELPIDRTRVRLELQWEPEGFLENVGAALQLDDLRVRDDLQEFARLMESNGFATGAWRHRIDEPPRSVRVDPDDPAST